MNKDKLDAAIVKFEAMASDAIGIANSSEGNRQKKEAAMKAYNALDIGIAALRNERQQGRGVQRLDSGQERNRKVFGGQ